MPELEIFVSWSKPASHEAAEAFKDWLPEALPGVKPWVSSEDVTKGTPWFAAISGQLARSGACLLCITPENVGSPWLFYEAGAIALALRDARICPYLIGVGKSDLAGTPLGQYQMTVFDKDDTWRLVRDLNGRLDAPHDAGLLRRAFGTSWPGLERKLGRVLSQVVPSAPPADPDESDLSDEAKHLLVEVSKDDRGVLAMGKSSLGFDLTAHGVQLVDGTDPRVEAAYREAVNDLVSRRLFEPRGTKGESFALTNRGWKLADELAGGRRGEPARSAAPVTDDADALCLLQSWWGGRTEEQNLKAVAFEDVDRELNLAPGVAARLLEGAAQKHHYVLENKGPKYIVFRKVMPSSAAPYFSNPGRDDPRNPYRRRP